MRKVDRRHDPLILLSWNYLLAKLACCHTSTNFVITTLPHTAKLQPSLARPRHFATCVPCALPTRVLRSFVHPLQLLFHGIAGLLCSLSGTVGRLRGPLFDRISSLLRIVACLLATTGRTNLELVKNPLS